MFTFEISIDPIIANIGPLALRWYSLGIMVSIIVAVLISARELKRREIHIQNFDLFVFLTVAGGILGARLFHVIDRPEAFIDNPARILAFNEGGLAIYGAVVGGFATVAALSFFMRLPFLSVIDSIAPGLVLAQAIGRFGCIVNGDAWGAPTNSPFAFIYTNPDAMLPRSLLGVPTHPYPVYDMILNLAIFAVLWKLRTRTIPAGALFATFAGLYAIGRFFISFVRQEQVWFWGLQEAQVIAIAILAVSVVALYWLYRRQVPSRTVPAGV